MSPKLFDLRPDRSLLDPNFDGYKLSLQEIKTTAAKLSAKILRHNKQGYHTYKQTKLFSLHNHLTGETINNADFVYAITTDRQITKFNFEAFTTEFTSFPVWKLPENEISYNPSLSFPGENLAVGSDGAGSLYVLETGPRSENHPWKLLQTEKLGFDFVIRDTNIFSGKLNCLLHNVEENLTKLQLVTFDLNSWECVKTTTFQSKGELYTAHLHENAVITSGDTSFSGKPENVNYSHSWEQTATVITVKIPFLNEEFSVDVKTDSIKVLFDGVEIFGGELLAAVKAEEAKWETGNGSLEIMLPKAEVGVDWTEVLKSFDENVIEESNEKLKHMCSEDEVLATPSSVLNTDYVEECDFPTTTSGLIERLTPEVTHRAFLGTFQVLFSLGDAIVIQQNEDACVWKPEVTPEGWRLKHTGTLMAFGYIQASKQRKKFATCSPNLDYSIVCESNKHLFVYRQNRKVEGGELRNRTSGRRVKHLAQQQVVSLTDEEILGVFASDSCLFLLSDSHVYGLIM